VVHASLPDYLVRQLISVIVASREMLGQQRPDGLHRVDDGFGELPARSRTLTSAAVSSQNEGPHFLSIPESPQIANWRERGAK